MFDRFKRHEKLFFVFFFNSDTLVFHFYLKFILPDYFTENLYFPVFSKFISIYQQIKQNLLHSVLVRDYFSRNYPHKLKRKAIVEYLSLGSQNIKQFLNFFSEVKLHIV
jgi:hypothetical protein